MRRTLLTLLALYIDFIVIGTFVTLASFFLGLGWDWLTGEGQAWYVELGTTVALTGLARAMRLSLGEALLDYAREEVDEDSPRRLWPNLVVGTFLLLDGLKAIVRWTQFETAIPVFGLVDTTPLKVVLLMALGGLAIAAGVMLIAFLPKARLAAVASLVASGLSLVLSWSVLPEALARIQVERRAAQQLPIREGEIEMMQAMMSAIAATTILVVALLIWLSREQRA